MSEDDVRNARRERDMILAPNEYAFINDETKGEVNVFVGPNKQSLAGTDRCVTFDLKTKRFKPLDLASGIQTFQTAPEGWYIVLKNPAENDKFPSGNGKLSTPNLRVGKKVNISGPASFPLWPGQMSKVVQGHSLRSNEYLLVRVYDEAAARDNWSKAVIKTQADETSKTSSDIPSEKDLSMGKLFVIRGTEVSFYIPPTGIEVVPEKVNGEERYVREAVSLERLEYCLLLDQNGNKRYVRGPDVVFPKPTEKFVDAAIKSNPDKARAKKFRAQELTPTSGIHIRVIADYTEDDGTHRKAGDELFITGAVQPVYFPREEHAIIKYGEQDVHYGIAIPAGEARYVLDRLTGDVTLVNGPKIFLPDPRTQVVAQRALPMNLCSLLYPGNEEALAINAQRLGVEDQDYLGAGGANAAFLNSSYVRNSSEDEAYGAVAAVATPEGGRRAFMIKGSSKSLPGDAFDRKAKFTAPRSVILNTKYDGAVSVNLWTGYAMLLVAKSGKRRVIEGPGTFLLEYDESPQVMSLSRGQPKTTTNLLHTVYLLTKANKVADVIEVETKDFCKLNVKLSYRVNFEGDNSQWFNVDNYVKFLCDHMRSKVRSTVQKIGIEEFHGNHTDILRDIILGKSTTQDGTVKSRPGTRFEENGMRIYDVEVLGIQMQNPDVEKLLVGAQREVIQNTLTLASERRKLDFVKETEEIRQQIETAKSETQRQTFLLQAEQAKQKLQLDLAQLEANIKVQAERLANQLENEKAQAMITKVQLDIQDASDKQRLLTKEAEQQMELRKLETQTQALVDKAAAVSPDLIAALSAFGDRAMVEKVAESMAPLSILGGGSVVDVLKKLLEGTNIAKQLEAPTNGVSNNGTSSSGKRAHS